MNDSVPGLNPVDRAKQSQEKKRKKSVAHYTLWGYMGCVVNTTLTERKSPMPNCHEMKPSEAYTCTQCGLELVVTQSCSCEPGCNHCSPKEFSCCDQPLVKKEG